jgi:hypothetical protein
MAEWFKAPVLKTGLVKANVGSNPSPSAGDRVNNRIMGRCQRGRLGSPAK